MLSQKEQIAANHTALTSKIPFELWDMILQQLAPSQLTNLAQVSKVFNQIVHGLTVWQVIWSTAELASRETSNVHQDLYESVLASSKCICEGCYRYLGPYQVKHTLDRERTEVLLQISRFSDTRTPLCGTCNHIRQELRQKREEELDRYLKAILDAKICCASFFTERQLPYILSGKQEDMKTTVDFIFRKSVHPKIEALLSRQARGLKLVLKLQEYGIHYSKRFDTFQSSDYVRYGYSYSLDKAVESVARSYWLRYNTKYKSIYRRMKLLKAADQSTLPPYTPPTSIAQEEALKGYIHTRFQNNQWFYVGDDPNTPARPPSTLWNRIEQLSRTLCMDYSMQQHISLNTLIAAKNLNTLTDENIVQTMDDNAKRRMEMTQWPTSLSALSFSERLRQLFGNKWFDDLLNDCRKDKIV